MIGRAGIASRRLAFAPDKLRGMLVWLDANAPETTLRRDQSPAGNNQTVEIWRSRGPRPFRFDYQTFVVQEQFRPLKINNVRNGLPVVRFGVGCTFPSPERQIEFDGAFSVFAAMRPIATPTSTLSTPSDAARVFGTTNSDVMLGLWNGQAASRLVSATPPLNRIRPVALAWTVIHSYVVTRYVNRPNPTELSGITFNAETMPSYTVRPLREPAPAVGQPDLNQRQALPSVAVFMGARNDKSLQADIGELIVYDREQTPANAQKIIAYLSQKWGI